MDEVRFRKEEVVKTPVKQSSALTSLLKTPTGAAAAKAAQAEIASGRRDRRGRSMSLVEVFADDGSHRSHSRSFSVERPRRSSESSVDHHNNSDNEPCIVFVYFPSGDFVTVIVSQDDCTVHTLVSQVLSGCIDDDKSGSNEKLIEEVELRVALNNGVPDDDLPPLDVGSRVHKVGASSFVVWPLSREASTVLSSSVKIPEVRISIGGDVLRSRRRTLDPTVRMFRAAESGDMDTFQHLVESNQARISSTGIDNWTPLHFASRCNHMQIVHYILKNTDADIDACTKTRWTPLHLAAFQGHLEMCETLLMYGANPQLLTQCSHSARQLAEQQHHEEVASVIVDYEGDDRDGGDMNSDDDDGGGGGGGGGGE